MSSTSEPYNIHLGNSNGPSLESQLESIPKDAEWLRIEDEVPTDDEWELLGSHFTSVQNLEVEAGWNEHLNDGLMPETWPLKRLLMSSSCGQVTENPHILLGKVHHLIMLLTMGIRFEGPTSFDLTTAHKEAIAQGTKEDDPVTDSGIKITYQPQLVQEWMAAKYGGKSIEISATEETTNSDLQIDVDQQIAAHKSGAYNLTKLEIIDNDAMEAFVRFTLALPQISLNLKTLNIRSANGCDLNEMSDSDFTNLLSGLDQLDTLVLTLGMVFDEAESLYRIYQCLPKNIRKLRFRGPVTLTQHDDWQDWVAKFGDPEFLPNLECLSFVCDMAYDNLSERGWRRKKRDATEEELRQSKEKCERLLSAFKDRQQRNPGKPLIVEPFVDEWNVYLSHIDGVNPLWESI